MAIGDVQMVDLQPLPPPTWGHIISREDSLLHRSESENSHGGRRTVQVNTHYFSHLQRWLAFVPAASAFLFAFINVIAAHYEFFRDVLQPGFPIVCPTLLFAVGVAAILYGCRVDLDRVDLHRSGLDDEDSEEKNLIRRGYSRMWRWLGLLSPGGKWFHQKVQFLQLVGIINMFLVLQTSLETGQLRRYIMAQALVILVNAVLFPVLFIRHHPMYHTIGVMFMDIAIDAVYGAVIPMCMGLELAADAIWGRKDLEREQIVHQNHVRFLIVADRFVPKEFREMVQLIIPYVTLTVRLGDVRKARKLLNLGGLPSAGWSLFHKRAATFMYISFGSTIFLGCVWRCFLYTRCYSAKELRWGGGCEQQSFFTLEVCRCIYFHYEGKLKVGPYKGETLRLDDMADMVKSAKHALKVLSVWEWSNQTFPSLADNPNIFWVFFHQGGLQWMPSLQNNKLLERLVIRDHELVSVPDLTGLEKLKWLDVQNNSVTEPPDLKDNVNLQRLMLSDNRLVELPILDSLKHLKKIRAANNNLTSLPSFSENTELEVLDLTENKLVELPDDIFEKNVKLKEIKISENWLRKLPSLKSLKNLKEFDVANNWLQEIPSLVANPKICTLNVSGNLLTKLNLTDANNEHYLKNLTRVDVCDNRFADPGPKVPLGEDRRPNFPWECLCCRLPLFER